MDMKQLEVFIYVMENGSFSRAGELLHLSQPTVSAHVAALERELETPLLLRTTREVRPTEAGRLLYDYAGQMLSLRREAQSVIRRFTRERRGTVKVAASTIFKEELLPALLRNFRRQYPEIRVDVEIVDSMAVIARIGAGEAEVGFCGTRTGTGRCVFQEFSDDRLVVVTPARAGYRRLQKSGFPVRQLERELLVSREEGSGTRKEAERFLREMGVDAAALRISHTVDSNEAVGELVASGAGVAIMPWMAAERLRRTGKVLTLDFRGLTLRRKLYLLRKKGGAMSLPAQTFYDFAESGGRSRRNQFP